MKRALVTVGVWLSGCGPEVVVDDYLRITERHVRPIHSARAAVRTEEGDGSALFVFAADDPLDNAYVANVRKGGNAIYEAEDWWERSENYTNAGFLDNSLVFNWPTNGRDPDLEPGRRYQASARFSEDPGPWTVRTVVKKDDDFTQGTVHVRLVLDIQVAETPGWEDAIDEAVAIWREEIFDNPGTRLTLNIDKVVRTLRTRIHPPGFGDATLYKALAEERPTRFIDLVLVRALENGERIFGVAGGIPGPVGPTGRSAVVISMEESAGADGAFDDRTKVEILAETMAHEVGHYLGLFHPIELPAGSQVQSWDALPDTNRCTTFEACIDTLGDNLMFPTPICVEPSPGESLACLRQTRLTPDQKDVVQRYVLVE